MWHRSKAVCNLQNTERGSLSSHLLQCFWKPLLWDGLQRQSIMLPCVTRSFSSSCLFRARRHSYNPASSSRVELLQHFTHIHIQCNLHNRFLFSFPTETKVFRAIILLPEIEYEGKIRFLEVLVGCRGHSVTATQSLNREMMLLSEGLASLTKELSSKHPTPFPHKGNKRNQQVAVRANVLPRWLSPATWLSLRRLVCDIGCWLNYFPSQGTWLHQCTWNQPAWTLLQ